MPGEVSVTTPVLEAKLSFFAGLFRKPRLHTLEARELLLQASRFERIEDLFLERYGGQYVRKRIAVLATHSTQHLLGVLRLFLYQSGITPEFYVGPYDGILSEGLDRDSDMYGFEPDILVTLPSLEDLKGFPSLFSRPKVIDEWVETQAKPYLQIWQSVRQVNPSCLILHAMFVLPFIRQLGNLETTHRSSRTNCIRQLNDYLIDHRPSNVVLVDMDYFASVVGKENWYDEVSYFISKQPFTLRAAGLVSSFFAEMIAASIGSSKKCLVLDLDNTLWGGVVGDDGVSGIKLGPGDPVGEAYLAFQNHLRRLKERGVLLAVCSKNDEEIAKAPFVEHPDMVLKVNDFSAFVANWEDKITNIRRIGEELNIGTDSMVFFDDNPAEQLLVSEYEPSMLVVDVPEDPALFIRALEKVFSFEWLQLSEEDIARVESYTQVRKRNILQQKFEDYDTYLQSLGMEAWIEPTDLGSVARVCQLINKTNQFNLRTLRYTEGQLEDMLQDGRYELLNVRFRDRFTNYGIIGSVIIRMQSSDAFIDNWALSCRVFKRGVEDATVNTIIDIARKHGCTRIVGEYVQTKKNSYVASLFSDFGFSVVPGPAQRRAPNSEGILYEISTSRFKRRGHFILVHESDG